MGTGQAGARVLPTLRRYRILRMITWLPMGGIERKIAAVLPRLNKERFEVHLCCIRERGPLADSLEAAGIPVHLIPFKSRLDPVGMLRLRALTRRLGIDLVHSHMYRSNVPATILKLLDKNLKVVGHYHNVDTWESDRQERMDRFLARRRNMNVAVSEAVRRDVEERLGLPPELTTTLYNCVDLNEFRPLGPSERIAVRGSLGFSEEDVLVAMVARVVRQKNQKLVIEAMPELLRAEPRAHFLFIGGGPDEDELKEQVRQMGLAEHVTFLGRRDDVPRLLAASDVAVLPSLKEGFSNAVLESMACGVPMVVSNVGGNAEIIDHGENGFICDVSVGYDSEVEVNSAQFTRHVRRLLVEPDFRKKVSQAALERVQHYGIDAMVREIEQLYLEVLEG